MNNEPKCKDRVRHKNMPRYVGKVIGSFNATVRGRVTTLYRVQWSNNEKCVPLAWRDEDALSPWSGYKASELAVITGTERGSR